MKKFVIEIDENELGKDPLKFLKSLRWVKSVREDIDTKFKRLKKELYTLEAHIPSPDQIEQLISEAEIESMGLDFNAEKNILNRYLEDKE